MATLPSSQVNIKVGDRVIYRRDPLRSSGVPATVTAITCALGWREFTIRLDSGLVRIAAKYPIELDSTHTDDTTIQLSVFVETDVPVQETQTASGPSNSTQVPTGNAADFGDSDNDWVSEIDESLFDMENPHESTDNIRPTVIYSIDSIP